MYDLWLYVMSVQFDENTKSQILSDLAKLNSENGFYFANFKEKENYQSYNLKSYNYLLDTKMALEVLGKLEIEISDVDKILNYLEDVHNEINQIELDFISMGSFLTMMNQISLMIENKTNFNNFNDDILQGLQTLFEELPLSIDSISTAIDVQESFGDVIILNKDEIKLFFDSIQTSEGLFNIGGSTTGHDTLSTYLSIKVMTYLGIPVPKKAITIASLEKINEYSLLGINKN